MIPLEIADKVDYKNGNYLPSHGFWARAHTEDDPVFDAPTSKHVRSSQKYVIDGTWEPTDLSMFFGRINDIYSFFLGLAKFGSTETTLEQKRELVRAFTDNTLHSGFNYVNFYGDLKGLVGFDERLAMPAIVKRSPGFVNVAGVAEIISQVASALDTYESRQEALKEQYRDLHGYLSKANLLRGRADRLDPNDPISKYIRTKNSPFANMLGIDVTTIDRLTQDNALATAKILLSYHRRMERYHLFFVEGRVRLATSSDIANDSSAEGISGA